MIYACHLTEIPKHNFPELIQFYRYFPHKYPFLLTTSSYNIDNQRQAFQSDNEQVSVFDILFIEPEEWLKLDHHLKLSTSSKVDINQDDLFLDAFDRLFSAEKKENKSESEQSVNVPFTGGWFVFLAYELAQQIEPCLSLSFDNQLLPVAYAARVKKALIYDHKKEKIYFLSESDIDHKQSYQSLINDAQHIQKLDRSKSSINKLNNSPQEENRNKFLDSVSMVKNYIKEGDVFQVNLSRLWQMSVDYVNHTERAFSLSQILSKENPAPFSGLADFTSEQGIATIISSSPERLLKVKDNHLESRPIAGTHPRSTSEKEDLRLLSQLHEHPKEQAEHIMLIDLIRNDMGRVCVPGTVVVDELMANESYAHVHHIVSNVSGELQSNKTPGEVIKAMFPGGTITGCPKVRCMEIIAELEQKSRGAYTGSIGYINLDGSMDLNILIRTMVIETVLNPDLEKESAHKSKLSFRAGAGLVFDSIAEKELQETRAKAKGLLRTLQVSSS